MLKLKPKIYLQVQDDQYLKLYYSILSEDSTFELTDPTPAPTVLPDGTLVYKFYGTKTGDGPSEVPGLITDVPATKAENKKIIVIAAWDSAASGANGDGTSTGNSGDADDKG
ncbi:MAG: hypothetical protein CMO01_18520 [Thalassobius sp.]|nr:hypothetical protein [Thalassovita sp.]